MESKNRTGVKGLTERWRSHQFHDSFQIGNSAIRPTKWISAKDHLTASQIDQYLKAKKLRKDEAYEDKDFLTLRNRIISELSSKYGFVKYKIQEKISLKNKKFNFEESLEQFVTFKSDTSVPIKHKMILMNVWLPFYVNKGCQHPREFRLWKKQAQMHLKTVKKLNSEEKYSVNSLSTLTNSHNEYMTFLLDNDDITEAEYFKIFGRITSEMKKRGLSSASRKKDTYTEEDLLNIKLKIDERYGNEDPIKIRAYAIFFGVCTGLRRGNLLGIRTKNLYPNSEVPHFETSDNIVPGWSRGIAGNVTLENSTKTFVGTIKLPFIQPSREILCEVTKYLIANLEANDRILNCNPRTVAYWWKDIADNCGFKYLTPHDWKHSYATIGALHLKDWYDRNPYLLQMCCLHQKYETTLQYINQKSDPFLATFKEM